MWFPAVLREMTRASATALFDMPRGNEPEDLDLARRQAARALAATRDAVAGGGEDGVDRLGVESTPLHLGLQLHSCFVSRERRPMWSWLAHRLIGIGGGQQSSGPGDRIASESARG